MVRLLGGGRWIEFFSNPIPRSFNLEVFRKTSPFGMIPRGRCVRSGGHGVFTITSLRCNAWGFRDRLRICCVR